MSVTFESKELPSFMMGRLGVVEKSPAHQIHEVEVAVAAFRLADGTSYVVFVVERYGVEVDVWHGVGERILKVQDTFDDDCRHSSSVLRFFLSRGK